MNNISRSAALRLSVLCAALLPILEGCNQNNSAPSAPSATSAPPAVSAPSAPSATPLAAPVAQPEAAAPAAPPPGLTQEQLYQLTAPIALFPDNLLAQVLAGATHPDQIQAANAWLASQRGATPEAIQNGANAQPWDVSVQALTAFPNVLAQMAQNIAWTTALGNAYASDPQDVMSAIQTLRQRAQASGHLKSSAQLTISSAPAPSYSGNADNGYLVPPPPQTIVIEPAQPNVVYVPQYDPSVVYGEPQPLYYGYSYSPAYAEPGYSGGDVVAAGLLAFGAGILIDQSFNHRHGWGWNSWGVNWGDRDGNRGRDRSRSGADFGRGGLNQPSVTFNNAPYRAPQPPGVPNFWRQNGQNGQTGQRGTEGQRTQGAAVQFGSPAVPARPNFGAAPGQNLPNGGPQPARPGAPGGFQPNAGVPHFQPQDTRRGAPEGPGAQRPGEPAGQPMNRVPMIPGAPQAQSQQGAYSPRAPGAENRAPSRSEPAFSAPAQGPRVQQPQQRPEAQPFRQQPFAPPRQEATQPRAENPPSQPRVEAPQPRPEAPQPRMDVPREQPAQQPRPEPQQPRAEAPPPPRIEAPRAQPAQQPRPEAQQPRVEAPPPPHVEAPRAPPQPQPQSRPEPAPQPRVESPPAPREQPQQAPAQHEAPHSGGNAQSDRRQDNH